MNKLTELLPNERKIVALALAEVASNPGLSLDASVVVTRLALLFNECDMVVVSKTEPEPQAVLPTTNVLSLRRDH